MWCVVVHIQLVLLVFAETRLPVPLHPVAVYPLASFHHRIFLLAWLQAVIFAIVAATWRQNVLGNVTGGLSSHVTRHRNLAAQQLSGHFTNGSLVHGEWSLTPKPAAGQEVIALGHDARSALITHVLAMLPDSLAVARVAPA